MKRLFRTILDSTFVVLFKINLNNSDDCPTPICIQFLNGGTY
jgi:hypothetical protein